MPATAAMSSWRSLPTTEPVAIGRIVGAKGLQGRLKLELLTDRPERFAVGASVRVEGEPSPRRVTAVEGGERPRAIALSGIDSREAAEAVTGRYLEADAAPLPDGSWYWHELEGLAVSDPRGRPIGRLAEVFRAGGAEVYRIERDGADDLLVPALRRMIESVDPASGSLVLSDEALEEPD